MRFRKTCFARLAAALIPVFVTLTGCGDAFVTDIEIPLPDAGRELVVEATLRPDDTSFVFVTRPISLNTDGSVSSVAGASVTLRVGGQTITSFEEVERPITNSQNYALYSNASAVADTMSVYLALLPEALFAPGAVFELEVVSPEGDLVTAREPVAPPGEFTSVTLTKQEYGATLAFTIRDTPGESAYILDGRQTYYSAVYDTARQPNGELNENSSMLYFYTGDELDYVDYDERFFTEDAEFEGGSSSFRLNTSVRNTCYDCDSIPAAQVVLSFRTVNPLAVDYYRALQSLAESEDNPFVEPVVIPTAFEGGRGMLTVQSRATVLGFEVDPG